MNIPRLSRLSLNQLCHAGALRCHLGRSLLSTANFTNHGAVTVTFPAVRLNIHKSSLLHSLGLTSPSPVLISSFGSPTSRFLHTLSLASPRSPTLQFVTRSLLQATHRSRTPLTRGRGTYGSNPFKSKGPLRRGFDALPGKVVIWGILGLNGIVFLAWYVATANYRSGDPSLLIKLHQNFVTSAQNLQAGRIWTLLTSCFSHKDGMHMLFNSIAIYTISPLVVAALGNTGFLAFYLGSGVIANVFSYYWHRFARPDPKYSAHGASGSMSAVTAFLACMMPNATFLFFGVVPMPAWLLVGGLLAYDGYNTYNNVQNGIDAAGHVGGILTGMLYFVRRRFGA